MMFDVLHQQWIEAIANDPNAVDSTIDGIIDHIQRHATAHLQSYIEEKKDMRLWAAGMLNLMCIFEEVVLGGRKISFAEMVDRLENKATYDPRGTPCPNLSLFLILHGFQSKTQTSTENSVEV